SGERQADARLDVVERLRAHDLTLRCDEHVRTARRNVGCTVSERVQLRCLVRFWPWWSRRQYSRWLARAEPAGHEAALAGLPACPSRSCAARQLSEDSRAAASRRTSATPVAAGACPLAACAPGA